MTPYSLYWRETARMFGEGEGGEGGIHLITSILQLTPHWRHPPLQDGLKAD